MILYHGSPTEVIQPSYGLGRKNRDYGQGFYMTKTANLGREWAVRAGTDGCLNRYRLDTKGLNVLDLNDGRHCILHWLCLVLASRDVDIASEVMDENLEYLKKAFSLDIGSWDCITGWPADNTCFSYSLDFVSNGITYEMLGKALHMKDREMQYVLVSPKAFERITFLGSETVDNTIWYPRKHAREAKAEADYDRIKEHQKKKPSQGLLMTDIVRQEMDANDPRLCL